ncbi:unnamed protein product [Chrysoparadoxa australica]
MTDYMAFPPFPEDLHLYQLMRDVGNASYQAIAMKMRSDGIDEARIASVMAEQCVVPGRSGPIFASSVGGYRPQNQPSPFPADLQHFQSMRDVGGASDKAIEMRMRSYGVSEVRIAACFGEAHLPTGASLPEDLPLYETMRKVAGTSFKAMAMKMRSDNISSEVISQFLVEQAQAHLNCLQAMRDRFPSKNAMQGAVLKVLSAPLPSFPPGLEKYQQMRDVPTLPTAYDTIIRKMKSDGELDGDDTLVDWLASETDGIAAILRKAFGLAPDFPKQLEGYHGLRAGVMASPTNENLKIVGMRMASEGVDHRTITDCMVEQAQFHLDALRAVYPGVKATYVNAATVQKQSVLVHTSE